MLDNKQDLKYKLHYGAKLLSWVSGLTSLSMGIIIVYSLSILPELNQNMYWFATLRVIGEVCGYFARILAGFITENSRKNLKLLILVGYAGPLVFKIMFFLSMINYFSIPTRCILFGSANILDKIFNVWRDIPRDVAIVEFTHPDNLRKTVTFRKFMANSGTALGGFIVIVLKYMKSFSIFNFIYNYELLIIFTFAFIPSLLSSFLLYYNGGVFDELVIKNNENKLNSKYNFFHKWWIFILAILIVIMLFSGKVNEMHIFSKVNNIYNTELLYLIYYILSPISLLVSYKNNKNTSNVTLLIAPIIFLLISVGALIKWENSVTIVVSCVAYATYTSTLDTVLFSSIINGFKDAKYIAILLAIINIFMGLGSLLSIKIINFANTLYNNQISLLVSMIPVILGGLLIIATKSYLFKSNNNDNK
jgi:hypothetical protein